MKFCCASNAAIKNVKIARKKSTFFPKYFQQNRHFFKKNTDFQKTSGIFSDFGGSSRHFDYLLTCLGLIIKL